MTQYGTWVSYSGLARIWLALILLAAAAFAAYAGARLPARSRASGGGAAGQAVPGGPGEPDALRPPTRPHRRALLTCLLVTWVLAIAAFSVGVGLYARQAVRQHLAQAPPADPITPVTLIGVGAIFVIILVSSHQGARARLTGAIIGALAAPMVFELPFDLVVMGRTYPPIPPDPAAYRALFFAPLVLIEITTLGLLALSPLVRLSRAALLGVALMLALFAVWALAGFGYPSSALPITLNVAGKLAAFAAVLGLFLPPLPAARAPGPARATLGGPG